MKIQDIDKNFSNAATGKEGIKYYDASKAPMVVEGLPYFRENGLYQRIKPELWGPFEEGIRHLFTHSSGGNVRFITNSTTIAVRAELNEPGSMLHMPNTGSSGFDVYFGKGKDACFVATAYSQDANVDSVVISDISPEEREVTINFPLYNGFKHLYIGLDEDAVLKEPSPHAIDKPVLFYGSSITQGGCASRPGNMYPSIICRRIDAPIINLGFSGCAKGEPEMAEIISGFDISCFVMDYDHNNVTSPIFAEKHSKFFNIIRENKPELPIVIVTRPDVYHLDKSELMYISKNRKGAYDTYQKALANGDKNVYFVPGETLFQGLDASCCTVDGIHPNDLGFYRMANVIGEAVKQALKI